MARVYTHVTHGSENPTRAGLGWLMAKGMIEAGHSLEVTLAGDGAILAIRTTAENVLPVGLPSAEFFTVSPATPLDFHS